MATPRRRHLGHESAEHSDRRPRRPVVVSVHAARTGHSGSVRPGRAAAQSPAGQPDAQQREFEPAESQSDRASEHRSRAGASRWARRRSGIEQALANAYNQQQVSTIFMPTNQYTVVMETVPSAQVDATVLEHFYVPAAGGRQVPLTEVADFEMTTGPLSVAHSGQMASMTISFNLAQGVSLGAATAEVERIATASASGVDHRRLLRARRRRSRIRRRAWASCC